MGAMGRRRWRSVVTLAVVCSLVLLDEGEGIYADQAGQVDWSVRSVGKVVAVDFAAKLRTSSRMVVGSDLGVVASMSRSSGSLQWRFVSPEKETPLSVQLNEMETHVIVHSVSPSSAYAMLRVFGAIDGVLLWEQELCSATRPGGGLSDVELLDESFLAALDCENTVRILRIRDGFLQAQTKECEAHEEFVGLGVGGSDEEDGSASVPVIGYNRLTNATIAAKIAFTKDRVTEPTTAVFIERKTLAEELCTHVRLVQVAANVYACSGDRAVLVFDILAQTAHPLTDTKIALNILTSYPTPSRAFVIHDLEGFYHAVNYKTFAVQALSQPLVDRELCMSGDRIVVPVVEPAPVRRTDLTLFLTDLRREGSKKEEEEEEASVGTSLPTGVVGFAESCFLSENDGYLLVVTSGADLVMVKQLEALDGAEELVVAWVREESLAYTVDFVFSHPVEPSGEAVEGVDRSSVAGGDPLHWLLNAVKGSSLWQMYESSASSSSSLSSSSSSTSSSAAAPPKEERVVVVLSAAGKVFGLSTHQGRILWSREAGETDTVDWERRLYRLREDRIAVLVTSEWKTTVQFLDPVTGEEVASPGMFRHGSVMAMAWNASLLLLGPSGEIKRIPFVEKEEEDRATRPKEDVAWVVADRGARTLRGYLGSANVRANFEMSLPRNERIAAIATVPDEGKFIASSSRATGDRRLLHKYINRLAIGVMSRPEPGTVGVTAMLIDPVSGSVLHSCHHENGTEPVSIVRCENWMMYSFWDALRQEQLFYVVDYYEARKDQWLGKAVRAALMNAITGLDTVDGEHTVAEDIPRPIPVRKGFTVDGTITGLTVTNTEHAITMRHVLVSVDASRIILLPKMLLDPRRPVGPPSADEKVEFVTHDLVLPRLGKVATAPVHDQESSCHVVASGIDIFYTTISPVGKFDTLTDDFNHRGLAAAIALVGIASIALPIYAKRVQLNRRWLDS